MKIYLPLLYSEKVKRPDKKYFLNNIIGEDFLILLLSLVYASSHPLLNTVGLFCLQIAFWCIYELGYIENDVIGEKFEDKAVLSYSYQSYEYSFSQWQPWLWSLFLSVLGILLVGKDQTFAENTEALLLVQKYGYDLNWLAKELLLWTGFLILLRLLFHIYNKLNKQSRVWFYLLLQACRYCGYLIVLTTNMVGLMLLLSSILTRSIQYILYRYLGGKKSNWPMNFPRYFFCLLIFVILLGSMALNNRDFALVINPQVLLITVFCLLRGVKHFYNVFTHFLPISEDGSNRVTQNIVSK